MKKFYMTMVALLCGAAAMAQENIIYVEDLTVEQGSTVLVPVCLKNTDPVVQLNYKWNTPPAGITVPWSVDEVDLLQFNEERLDLETARAAAEAFSATAAKLYQFDLGKGKVTFGPKTTGYREDGEPSNPWIPVTFLGNDGPIVLNPLTVAEDCELGEYTLSMKNISLSSGDFVPASIATSKTAEFKLTVTPATGIIKVNADDPNAPVYNVAGQRVSKAQKGIFIQNGKKVAVK